MSGKDSAVRVNQAVLLLAGAAFLVIIVSPVAGRFYWTPLTIGVAYLAAAVVGGRRGGHWATACALTGWGAAVTFVGAAHPDLDTSGLYLTGAGLGVAAGLALQRFGFDVSSMGLAVTIAAGGAILALTPKTSGVLDDARTYAVGLGLVALVNLALAARAGRAPRRRPDGRKSAPDGSPP